MIALYIIIGAIVGIVLFCFVVRHIIKKLCELKNPNNDRVIYDKIYSKKKAYPLFKSFTNPILLTVGCDGCEPVPAYAPE